MQMIWSKGFSEIQIYKTANIDRRLFSKIRSNSTYHPQKQTILQLLIALKVELSEAEDLLSRAGFAFSPTNPIDVIYRFCIINKIYKVDMVEELIYESEKMKIISPKDKKTLLQTSSCAREPCSCSFL